MDLFTLDRAHAGYESLPVLRGVSLSVSEGEFVAVIGPNGAGKSTLLRLLSGEMRPFSGSVRFRGREMARIGARRLSREFSVVHQKEEYLQAYTVGDFVKMGRFPHRGLFSLEGPDDREAVERAIAITGIEGFRDRKLTALSGGELQLAWIAHALAQNERVILLDEPVSHLDIRHALRIMDILHGLNRGGSTIVCVLHDINLASDYGSRIVGLKDGAIFFDGAPGAVLDYARVEELFGTVCTVTRNPVSGRPFVYPVPAHVRRGEGS